MALQDPNLNPYSLLLSIIFVPKKITSVYLVMLTLMHLLLFAPVKTMQPNAAELINLFLFHNFPSL